MNDFIPIEIKEVVLQEHSDGGNTVISKLSSAPTNDWIDLFDEYYYQDLDNMRGPVSLENDNMIIKYCSRNQLESLKKYLKELVHITNNMYKLKLYRENQ